MNREEALQALEVLRKVVSQTRDDTVLQNWGLIWIIQGLINMAGFVITNVLFWKGYRNPWCYPPLWFCIVGVNLAVSFKLKSNSAGTKSFIESQIYSIWLIFFASVLLVGVVNHLMGLEIFLMAPMIAVLAAVALASMGSIMGRQFFLPAAASALAAILMALVRDWQFLILGLIWGSFQVAVGVRFHLERRRRLASGALNARLV